MAWPTPPLDVEVSLALGADLTAAPSSWTWTVISSYLRAEPGVRIVRGRPNEQSLTHTSMCLLTLDNRDGRFSPRNPLGAYYGQIRRNTPLRVRVRADSGDPYTTRFVGYVSEWPQRWDVSGRNFWAPIQADGVMRRLGQGNTPLKSALRRSILAAADAPVAYWPMEDEGPLSSTIAAEVGADAAMPALTTTGGDAPDGSAGALRVGFDTDPLFGQSTLRLAVTPYTATGTTVLTAHVRASLDDAPDEMTYLSRYFIARVSGTVSDVTIAFEGGVSSGFTPAVTVAGGGFSVSAAVDIVDTGGWHEIQARLTQDGADVDVELYLNGALVDSGTATSRTVGTVTSLANFGGFNFNNTTAQSDGTAVFDLCHVSVHTSASVGQFADAMDGYAGETASARVTRLCAEESVAVHVPAGDSALMGPQRTNTLMSLLRECEAADSGVLREEVTGELCFHPLEVRYNQAVALTLDYSQGHVQPPLEPTDDDQLTRNDVTADRVGGSRARVVDEDGQLGVDSVGRYDDAVSLNVYSDDQLDDAAGWRVNIGTADELRWPRISLNLRRNPDLVADWLAVDIGSRIKLTNLPNSISYDDADLIIEGYTEVLTPTSWTVELNCAPYAPYKVFTLAEDSGDTDEFLGRLVPDTCYSVDAHDSDDTSWLVFTDPPWTETADDFPCAVRVLTGVAPGGELATLTAVAPAAEDAFTRSVTDGWGTPDTGPAYSLIGTAADFDVNGSAGTITPSTLGSDRIAWVDVGCPDQDVRVVYTTNTTAVGGATRAGLALRVTDSANHYRMILLSEVSGLVSAQVSRRAGGTLTVLRSTPTNLLVATADIAVRATATALTRSDGTPYVRLRLKLWYEPDPEPWVWTIEYEDESPVTGDGAGVFGRLETGASAPTTLAFDEFRVSEPKTWTVIRSVNGVVKSHAASAEIEIDEPTVLAL